MSKFFLSVWHFFFEFIFLSLKIRYLQWILLEGNFKQ